MLADQFKRKIDYLRVSVTDRCDLRCTYCMAEDVTFLPRQEVLSIEEIIKLIDVFNELGVKKFRLTGGEPLVRKNIISVIEHLFELKKQNIKQKELPPIWNMFSMHKREMFSHNWQDGVDKTPFFIKYSYLWHFTGFAIEQRTDIMKQTWDLVSKNYE